MIDNNGRGLINFAEALGIFVGHLAEDALEELTERLGGGRDAEAVAGWVLDELEAVERRWQEMTEALAREAVAA